MPMGDAAVSGVHLWGSRGRWFESSPPDQDLQGQRLCSLAFFFLSSTKEGAALPPASMMGADAGEERLLSFVQGVRIEGVRYRP